MAAAAVFAFTACETTDPDNGDGGAGSGESGENEIVYQGVTYKTVTLSNGQTWMAEPLRYVPDGMTVSNDPADDNAHIWYPYENDGSGTAVAATDDETVAAKGYLYDMYAALGNTEVTADNCAKLEGVRGICPEGWHIPTRAEYLELCGLSNKDNSGEETGNVVNEDALFYDATYGGGNVRLFNEGGWNFVLTGTRMKTNFAATGKYQATWVSESNSTTESLFGEPALTYIMTSTCYKPIYSSDTPSELTNIQFFALMTTFNKGNSPEGKVNLSYVSTASGQQLRCIKDAE